MARIALAHICQPHLSLFAANLTAWCLMRALSEAVSTILMAYITLAHWPPAQRPSPDEAELMSNSNWVSAAICCPQPHQPAEAYLLQCACTWHNKYNFSICKAYQATQTKYT